MSKSKQTSLHFPKDFSYPCLRDLYLTVEYGQDGDDLWIESLWIEDDTEQQDLSNLISHSYYKEVDGSYHSLETLVLELLWEQLH